MKSLTRQSPDVYFAAFSRYIVILLPLLAMALSAMSQQTFHGSGSRDLYPDGVAGGRAKLRASTLVSAEATPFPTLGVHYVYAQAGEIIAMASSVQGLGSGRIRITPPTGSAITSPNNSTGRIAGGLVGGLPPTVMQKRQALVYLVRVAEVVIFLDTYSRYDRSLQGGIYLRAGRSHYG